MSAPRVRDSWKLLVGVAVLAMATPGSASPVASRCVLPVPDGGALSPSRENLTGRLSAVGAGFVEVRPLHGGHPVKVRYDAATGFYSSFGGDYDPSEFAVGQRVWVWFVGCRQPAKGTPRAAYVQLYSRDPDDQPPVR